MMYLYQGANESYENKVKFICLMKLKKLKENNEVIITALNKTGESVNTGDYCLVSVEENPTLIY